MRKLTPVGSEHGVTTSSDLFAALWQALADILGTAAAATLLRRAAQLAVRRAPELAELSITRGNLEYEYAVPVHWQTPMPEPPHALRELSRALWPLLVEMTGSVVVNRLTQSPELRAGGILPTSEEQP
jgi:hypothetical protein